DGWWGRDSLFSDWLRQATERIVGWDRNGLAVLAARANWLLALGPWIDPSEEIQISVFQQDAILPARSEATTDRPASFDFVVGNPPWLVWDQLEPAYREATMPLWRCYGLFSLSAKDARHGGAKKDLAGLMTYTAADRYLKPDGRLAMLLPNSLLHTQGAGDGFRRFCLPDGTPLKVAAVEDFSQVRLFGNSAQRTTVLVLEKGQSTVYPVPYVRRRPGEPTERPASLPSAPSGEDWLELKPVGITQAELCLAEPIAPDQPSSPWWIRPALSESAEGETPWRQLVGPADYVAYLGANTGGANEVFWFDLIAVEDGKARLRNRPASGRGRRPQAGRLLGDSRGKEESRPTKPSFPAESCCSETVLLEPERLFPLVRWQDVHRWQARPSCWILLVQDAERRQGLDPDWLRQHCPATWEYLERWEARLRRRAAYRRYQAHAPFYSLYNVGPYTLSRYKVVWRRMDRQIRAAVLTPMETPWGYRAIVPQETCTFIPTETAEEAYYLAALLNSDWVNQLVQRGGLSGTKGFGSPGMLRWIRLRRFEPTDARHQKLAELAKTMHLRLQQGKTFSEMEAQINALV
ncbi:MAG TPA: hypothetical protein PK777_13230, partial [Thermoguttaceae bacterium]|nr:hypothetical protein [Thermoguttaceae bacterium]